MKQNVYFVSGIDTDAGKSYATGFLAREWNKNGQRTITQKFIQLGSEVWRGRIGEYFRHSESFLVFFCKGDSHNMTMQVNIL